MPDNRKANIGGKIVTPLIVEQLLELHVAAKAYVDYMKPPRMRRKEIPNSEVPKLFERLLVATDALPDEL